jgi:hypothetical protein
VTFLVSYYVNNELNATMALFSACSYAISYPITKWKSAASRSDGCTPLYFVTIFKYE